MSKKDFKLKSDKGVHETNKETVQTVSLLTESISSLLLKQLSIYLYNTFSQLIMDFSYSYIYTNSPATTKLCIYSIAPDIFSTLFHT